MEQVRCQCCGELIEDSLVNREEDFAFCRQCGGFTYLSEGMPRLPLIPLRELLAHPPPTVRTEVRDDGTQVLTIRAYDRARQFRNLAVSVVVGLLSLAVAFGMVVLPSCEWAVISYEKTYDIAQFGAAFLVVLAFFCFGILVPFFLIRAFETMRLWLSPTAFTCRSYWFCALPMGRTRLARDARADVQVLFRPDGLPADEDGNPAAPFTDAEVVWWQMGRKEVRILQLKDLYLAQYIRAVLLNWLGEMDAKPQFRCCVCGIPVAYENVDVRGRTVHCPSCGAETDIQVAVAYRTSNEILRNPPPRGVKSLTESELKPGEHAGLSYRGWRVCWWWKVLFLLCWFLMCWFLKNQIPYFIECAVYEWQGLRFALVVGSALLIAYLWAMTIYRCRCELRIRDGRVICTSYARFRTQTSEIPLEGQTFAGLTDDEMGITISTNCGSESERVNLLLDGFSSSFCVWASAWLNIQLGRGEMNH